MIKYSPKRFGSCDSVFCRFVPILHGNYDELEEIVSYMESQHYIKYLKYKMPRKFGDSLFHDFIVAYNSSNRTFDFVSTSGVSRSGTGKLNYVLMNRCFTKNPTTAELRFEENAFQDCLHEAAQINQFQDREFMMPYRLENLVTEETWYNVCMPMIYNYFGHSDANIYICNVSVNMSYM